MTRERELVTSCEHVDRPHRALGYCEVCYHRYWRRVTRERLQRRLREYVGGEMSRDIVA